jgi:hypothetical protein
MRIGDRKKFFLPPIDPTTAGVGLAFWAMPVSTGTGELTITCLMGSIWLWGVLRWEGAQPLSHTPFKLPIKVWLLVTQSACPVD